MMYPRLRLAANLLRDDGVIFISIDDNEVHNLRKICDEVFGEENFVCEFVWKSKLKLGQDLATPIIPLDINRKIVWGVANSECGMRNAEYSEFQIPNSEFITFIVCLAEHITPEDAAEMAEYAPGRIIFTDQCFDNATDKSNVKLTLRNRGIEIKML